MYRTLNQHYREKFGCKVYKLSIDAGLTCPNRDGTVGTGGCIFCSGAGSGEFAEGGQDITAQLERAKARVSAKNKNGKYIAYFQAFTNTYAPVSHLRKLYYEAIDPDEIVGLAIGTRPDCLGADVVALTDRESSPLTPYADQLLTAHSDMASFVDSLVAPLSIINAIIVSVGRKKREELTRRLKELEEIWDEYDVYDKSGN